MNKIIGVCPSCGGPVFERMTDKSRGTFKPKYCSTDCSFFAMSEAARLAKCKRRGIPFVPGDLETFKTRRAEMLERRTPDAVKRRRDYLAKRDAEFEALGLPKPRVTVVNGVRIEHRGSGGGGSTCGTIRQVTIGKSTFAAWGINV